MASTIRLLVHYGGSFEARPCIRYAFKFRSLVETDADFLNKDLLVEDMADMLKYHRACKLHYMANDKDNNRDLPVFKEVRGDKDINKIAEIALSKKDNMCQLFVDHELPVDHPSFEENLQNLKELKQCKHKLLILKDTSTFKLPELATQAPEKPAATEKGDMLPILFSMFCNAKLLLLYFDLVIVVVVGPILNEMAVEGVKQKKLKVAGRANLKRPGAGNLL